MKDRERNVVGEAIHIIQPGGENLERANGLITLKTWRRRMVVDKRGLSVYVCPYLNYQTGPALLSISRPTHGLPWSMWSTLVYAAARKANQAFHMSKKKKAPLVRFRIKVER